MPSSVILTEQLTCAFKDVLVVDHVSLAVPRGAIFGLIGPSGAGKSTFLRLIVGLLPPTSGQITVLDRDPRTDAAYIRAHTGVLLEDPGLYLHLNGSENLDFYARIWRLSERERSARVDELLRHFGLWDLRAEPVAQWSRGMQRKLAVARALLHRPELVLLDEPMVGLDAEGAALLQDDLVRLAALDGVTILLTGDSPQQAGEICQQVALLQRGRLVAAGTPDELRRASCSTLLEVTGSSFSSELIDLLRRRRDVVRVRTQGRRLLIDLNSGRAAAAVISLIVEAGADVDEVRRRTVPAADSPAPQAGSTVQEEIIHERRLSA